MKRAVPLTPLASPPENLLMQLAAALARRRSDLLSGEARLWTELANLLSDASAVCRDVPVQPPNLTSQRVVDANPPKELLPVPEAAEFLGMSAQTMAKWRITGEGPEFVKYGHRVFYRRAVLEAFVAARTFPHTSAYAVR